MAHFDSPPQDQQAQPTQKLSLTLKKKPGTPAAAAGTKRPRDALQDEDDGDSDDDEAKQLHARRATKVSHFDSQAGGAIDEDRKVVDKGPLVIENLRNRDWKAEAVKKRRMQRGEANAPEKEEENAPETNTNTNTEDQEAMDALLGRTKKSDLTIPAVTEEDAFQQDYKTAPDMATLEDYARVPVEQFGAAMLRGMGWKEGDGIGNDKGRKVEAQKVPARRPALLGIGAKEEAAVAQELGAWGKAARGKGGREPVVYNPVLLRDKRTGETFTEEEARAREEKEERERHEREFERRERRREREGEGERRREREGEGRRHRREDSRDRERRRRDDRDRHHRDRGEDRHRRHERDRDGHRRRERSREHRRR
ncbi:hypothetical protein WHR41_06584 [Cladosporium halotolerans]|uniref:Pre-mRNA-splicing factor n=1 Tax=Cladosporium halotolerans TaxID=1052096 RepID=A0AB34KMB8_9PEZI